MRTLVVLAFLSVAAAQQTRVLEGEIGPATGVDRSRLAVLLQGSAGGGEQMRSGVEADGTFRFYGTAPGTYVLTVVDQSGNQLTSEPVQVNLTNAPVTVSLPHAKRERPPDGSISVARLRHKPNRAARKAFDRAQKFSGAGDYQQAASELQKAIAADDLYSEAHANLGVQYMKLSKFNEAVVEFRRAIALDQGTGAYYSNLALALAALHQVSEATTFARRGLDMDAANHKSQMVLGWVLASQPETRLAAIPYLEEAARGIPAAHRVLADLYRLSGRPELAARELRQYQATSMQHQPSFTPPEPGSPQREADALTASAVPRP